MTETSCYEAYRLHLCPFHGSGRSSRTFAGVEIGSLCDDVDEIDAGVAQLLLAMTFRFIATEKHSCGHWKKFVDMAIERHLACPTTGVEGQLVWQIPVQRKHLGLPAQNTTSPCISSYRILAQFTTAPVPSVRSLSLHTRSTRSLALYT